MKNSETFPRMHVSYYVSDLSKTIDFYTKFFEVEPVKVKESYAKYILTAPSLNISFIENPHAVNKDAAHFGIEVNDQQILGQKLGNAMHHNLPIDREKDVECCYAKQDKFWVTDPDGYKWEVYQFIEDSAGLESNANASECCAPKSELEAATFTK